MSKSKSNTSVNLSSLQSDAENAARRLKAAITVYANAKQALDRADAAHSVAQKTLQAGVDQVKSATKVS